MICTKTRSAKAISYSALRIQCNYTSEKAASANVMNKLNMTLLSIQFFIIRLSRIFPVKLLLQIIIDTFIQKDFRV